MTRYRRIIVLATAVLFALSLGATTLRAAGEPEPSPPKAT